MSSVGAADREEGEDGGEDEDAAGTVACIKN